jgi:hypothetical protein
MSAEQASQPDIWCITQANAEAYHTFEDCDYLEGADSYRTRTPRYIEYHGLPECTNCRDRRASR